MSDVLCSGCSERPASETRFGRKLCHACIALVLGPGGDGA